MLSLRCADIRLQSPVVPPRLQPCRLRCLFSGAPGAGRDHPCTIVLLCRGKGDSLTFGHCTGVNTGIMLVRNDKDTGWSEEFWGDVARVSRINREVASRTDSPEGRVKVRRCRS